MPVRFCKQDEIIKCCFVEIFLELVLFPPVPSSIYTAKLFGCLDSFLSYLVAAYYQIEKIYVKEFCYTLVLKESQCFNLARKWRLRSKTATS